MEGLRQDYVDTLSEWIARLDANLEEAERLAGGERVRVWRLYLRAARNGFATGFTSIFQVLGNPLTPAGLSGRKRHQHGNVSTATAATQ